MRERQGSRGTSLKAQSRSRILLLSSAALVVAADQVSKVLALAAIPHGERVEVLGEFFGLVIVRNAGGAFSLLPGRSAFLAFLTAVILVIVAVWAFRSEEAPVPFGMIIGGGLGNLADRVFRSPGFPNGRVVDFIDFSFWPTFNLADSAITIGVGLILILWIRESRRSGPEQGPVR